MDREDSGEAFASVLTEVELADKEWRLGNYEILEEIGRGGMGVIYRARQRHSRRIVALKRVLSYHADSQETLQRFRREAEAAASLDHPNILPIYEVSEADDGLPFFSMKFATGGSLREAAPCLQREPRRCVALVAKVARATEYAHRQGILHRDLKPGNILLDARGEPMVSDFGLAKWLDTKSDLTRTLTIFGTPGYIAPEQAHRTVEQLSPAADVYSLGAILFDLLAGRPPFVGAHALSVIRQASENPAPKLRALSNLVDRDLETICAKCLEREPRARYRSADDVAEDLERWLEGRPIKARPVSPPTRVWRWLKRNPKLAGSLAAIVILGAMGVAALWTSSHLSSVIENAELARHSIVIIPFEDLDDLSINSASAINVTAAFTTQLTQVRQIRVFQANTTYLDRWRPEEWKAIGDATNARFLLTGSVRLRNGKQRIAVRLLETASGRRLTTWLHDASSPLDAINVSRQAILAGLGVATAPTPFPKDSFSVANGDLNELGVSNNSLARGYYERGKELFFRNNLPDLARAIDSFVNAIALDPNYPQAYAMLATAYLVRSGAEPDAQRLEKADAAVATAMRLAPMLPEVHLAMGADLSRHGRIRAAVDAFLTAYELDERSARTAAKIGDAYDGIGRPDLAIPWYEKASRREARPLYADNMGDAWTDLGEYEKATEAYKTAGVFRPDLPVADLGFARLALLRGDYDSARQLCETARAKFKDNPQPVIMAAVIEFFGRRFDVAEQLYRDASTLGRTRGVDFPGCVRFISALGLIQKSFRRNTLEGLALLEEARALDEKESSLAPENPKLWYSFAADQAALGNEREAIAALNKAVECGLIDYRSMQVDPRFDFIRDTESFKEILSSISGKVEEMRRHLASRQLASNNNN